MGQKKPCVVYDLDGVLADTFQISLEVANLLVEMYGKRYGLKKIEPGDIPRYRNMRPDQIRKALGVPITLLPFIYREGKRLLAEETPKAKAFNGIYETVSTIHQSNRYDQLILTSNGRENTRGFLENNGLLEFFVELYTDFPILSKRAGLMQILSKKGITREEMVFVCDEVRDIHAAQGWEATLFGLIKPIPVISVGWGYNTPEALIAENPTAHISDPRELPGLLERLFNGK
jgi:phosphoglycolate phosphatase